MVSKESKKEIRIEKHRRLRRYLSGTAERPRMAVFRSNNHIYVQLIDDVAHKTLLAASTLTKEIGLEKTNDVAAASAVGSYIGKKALENGITEVVFDRGGYIYQGKVKALADAAREAGLVF